MLADSELASAKLDAIQKGMIDAYRQRRSRARSRYGRPLSPASVNRALATLRRLLRLAQAWEIIHHVPRIVLLRGERIREFVLIRIPLTFPAILFLVAVSYIFRLRLFENRKVWIRTPFRACSHDRYGPQPPPVSGSEIPGDIENEMG